MVTLCFLIRGKKVRFYYWAIMNPPICSNRYGPLQTPAGLSRLVRKESRARPPSPRPPPRAFTTRVLAAKQTHPIPFAGDLGFARRREHQGQQRWRWRRLDARGGAPSSPLPPSSPPWLRATRSPPSRKIPVHLLLLPDRSASS